MRVRPYLLFGDTEIANENRTLAYIDNGLLPSQLNAVTGATENCGCEFTDDGPYSNPGDDGAPWFDSSIGASREYLGILAFEIRLLSNIVRAVTPRGEGGASIGPLTRKHRIVSVSGTMLASTERGMQFGERWLSLILSGTDSGCSPDEMTVLTSCDADGFRTLSRVGIVDGPNFGPIQTLPECYVQEVQFQIAAGNPFLLASGATILPSQVFSTFTCATFNAPMVVGQGGVRIVVSAGSPDVVSGIQINGEPCDAAYSDTYSDSYGGTPGTASVAEYTINGLPPGTVLTIDSATETVTLTDAETGQPTGGFDVLQFSGLFDWITASAGACLNVCLTPLSGAVLNSDTTVSIDTMVREL